MGYFIPPQCLSTPVSQLVICRTLSILYANKRTDDFTILVIWNTNDGSNLDRRVGSKPLFNLQWVDIFAACTRVLSTCVRLVSRGWVTYLG